MTKRAFEIPLTRHMAIDPEGARKRLEGYLANPEISDVARNQYLVLLQQMGVRTVMNREARIAELERALESLPDSPGNRGQRNQIHVELIQLGWSSQKTSAVEVETVPAPAPELDSGDEITLVSAMSILGEAMVADAERGYIDD